MSKSVNVDFVTRQIEVDTDGKEYYVSAAVAAKDAEQSMLNAQNAANSVQKYKALWFDSVVSMKAEPSLTAGAYVCTAGYYNPNDGGGATYLIRTKADADIDDGGSLYELANGLVAELIVENGTVNVKQFGAVGDGVADDTNSINLAIEHGNFVYIPAGTYLVSIDSDKNAIKVTSGKNIKMHSDCRIVLSPNDSTHYYIFHVLKGSKQVKIIGGNIIGDRNEHLGTDGEWGFGISVYASENVYISDCYIADCWGDGIYLESWEGGNKNVTVERVICDNNRRLGIGVGGCDGLYINDCILMNTNGTNPQYGIDIEIDHEGDYINHVYINNLRTYNNKNGGLYIALPYFADDIDIVIDNWVDDSAGVSSTANNIFNCFSNAKKGNIVLNNIISKNAPTGFANIRKTVDTFLEINNLTIYSPNRVQSDAIDYFSVIKIHDKDKSSDDLANIGNVNINGLYIENNDEVKYGGASILILSNNEVPVDNIKIKDIKKLDAKRNGVYIDRAVTNMYLEPSEATTLIADRVDLLSTLYHSRIIHSYDSTTNGDYRFNRDEARLPLGMEVEFLQENATYPVYISFNSTDAIFPSSYQGNNRQIVLTGAGSRVKVKRESYGYKIIDAFGDVTSQ